MNKICVLLCKDVLEVRNIFKGAGILLGVLAFLVSLLLRASLTGNFQEVLAFENVGSKLGGL